MPVRIDPQQAHAEAHRNRVLLCERLQIGDDIVSPRVASEAPRHPPALKLGHRSPRVEPELGVAGTPARRHRVRTIDNHRLKPPSLQGKRGRQTCGARANDDGLVAFDLTRVWRAT